MHRYLIVLVSYNCFIAKYSVFRDRTKQFSVICQTLQYLTYVVLSSDGRPGHPPLKEPLIYEILFTTPVLSQNFNIPILILLTKYRFFSFS